MVPERLTVLVVLVTGLSLLALPDAAQLLAALWLGAAGAAWWLSGLLRERLPEDRR
ncbi:hypothetical protein ACQPX6_22945 [Actinomycetospora sp. CA-101289]|uniref:hypothetical protein n=1 Tax=Actinomycetospora sp. CA-101289 TaxID=3239893 RepID=UPI003D99BE66